MCKGFIKIPRRLFETRGWSQRRRYTEVEATIDLYLMANVRDRTEPNGLKLKKAQLITSYRELADRWLWPTMNANNFIKKLQRDGWISTTSTKSGTIITIIDFGTEGVQVGTQSGTPSCTHVGTPNGTPNKLNISDLGDNTCTPFGTPFGTHSCTQSGTPSRVYKNDNINIISIEEDKKNNIDSSLRSESDISSNDSSDEYSFDSFWDLYDKKVGKDKASKLYAQLSAKDKKAIFEYLPRYKRSQPDKKYRKNPETFLRNHSWNDEIISDATDTRLFNNSPDKFNKPSFW